jgi:hypothetical protein
MMDLSAYYPDILKAGKFEKDLKKIEKASITHFSQTIECLEKNDTEGAAQLLEDYRWVNPLCDDNLKKLVLEEDKTIASGNAVALAIYLRWLKRINSHLRNIDTSVVNPFDRIGFKPKQKKK